MPGRRSRDSSSDFLRAAPRSFAGVRFQDGDQRRRAHAVAYHGDGAAVADLSAILRAIDDVAGREALGTKQLMRLEHSQPDIHDHIRHAAQMHGDQREPVRRGDGR